MLAVLKENADTGNLMKAAVQKTASAPASQMTSAPQAGGQTPQQSQPSAALRFSKWGEFSFYWFDAVYSWRRALPRIRYEDHSSSAGKSMAGSRHETIEESAGEVCSLSSEQSAGAPSSGTKALPAPAGAGHPGQLAIEASKAYSEHQQVFSPPPFNRIFSSDGSCTAKMNTLASASLPSVMLTCLWSFGLQVLANIVDMRIDLKIEMSRIQQKITKIEESLEELLKRSGSQPTTGLPALPDPASAESVTTEATARAPESQPSVELDLQTEAPGRSGRADESEPPPGQEGPATEPQEGSAPSEAGPPPPSEAPADA